MVVLGINAFHGDSAACLVRDGSLLSAVEEERLRRIKHWAGFPVEAIRYCLESHGLRLEDVDYVAVNHDPRANLGRKIRFVLRHRPSLKLIADRIRNLHRRESLQSLLAKAFPGQSFRGTVRHVEHHVAHMASAFLVSPFEEAVVVSVDGFGDFASTAWGVGTGSGLSVGGRIFFPHSLGAFYQAMTQYLGFPHYGDEYKVMGLAPYGEAKYLKALRQVLRVQSDGFELDLTYFNHHRRKFDYTWEGDAPIVGRLFSPALEELLGPSRKQDEPLTQRHKDIACSVQAMYEEAFFHLLDSVHAKYGLDALTLAGGCAMNSVANGKIFERTRFRQIYVQAAPGDAGGAVGAAMFVSERLAGERRSSPLYHAYWGPAFTDREIEQLLVSKNGEIAARQCRVEQVPDEEELCARTAAIIAAGGVVGWFQGNMEWGPRALGNRSIICDPRRPDMKDILNLKIKRRESFRPFAPSILREAVAEWFETDADVPFMAQVFRIKKEKRTLIPAVTHVDGSGRLQTVERTTNPRYYRLIDAFRSLTGIPIVLNTSFNENEPIICRPEEALDCFLRTRMDVLVMENWMVLHNDLGSVRNENCGAQLQ